MSDGLPPDWTKRINEETGEESDRAQTVAAMLLNESDRGCAIFGAAILDEDLEALFRILCRQDDLSRARVVDPMFKGYAPLSTFSARIQLSYAMRLIPNGLYRKLEIVRQLRNDFAHESGPLDFQDPRCQGKLRQLIAEGAPRDNNDDDDTELTVEGQTATKRQLVERIAFVIAISELSARLCFITEKIEEGSDVHLIVAALEQGGK